MARKKKSTYVTITRATGKKVKVVKNGKAHKRHLSAKKAARTRAKNSRRR